MMRRKGPVSHTIEVAVAFHDVDMMGVVWHGQYLKYLENARWALMDHLGYGFDEMVSSGYLWPVIESHVRFIRPARFRDRLAVQASLVEWEMRLAVNYLATDLQSGERVLRGRTVQVAVDPASGAMSLACPPDFRRVVEASLRSAGPGPDRPA